MWYLDTHLHHLKETKGFTAASASIDHQPDLVCKIAALEPDSRMYLLGVSEDSLSGWVNRVQNQLNHVLTQGSKLDESGDLDQQANWTNRGIHFGFGMKSTVLMRASSRRKRLFRRVKLQKHRPLQQSGSQLVRNLPPRRKRLLPSLRQRNRVPVNIPTRAMEMKGKRAKKKRRRTRRSPEAGQRRKWQ